MLARAVLGHGRHDVRRDVSHVFDDHVGNMLSRPLGWSRLFGEFLKPLFKREAGRRFSFQRCRLFIWKLDHRQEKSPIAIVTAQFVTTVRY
jgi:hypothetical protein